MSYIFMEGKFNRDVGREEIKKNGTFMNTRPAIESVQQRRVGKHVSHVEAKQE